MDTVKKILWIDDDINRFSLMPYIDELKEKGITVVKAENPDESKEILSKEYDFQCIIVDISMPPGDSIPFGESKGGTQTGLLILKQLVEDTSLGNVKKVVFTIVDNAEVREYCNNQTPKIPYLEKHNFFTDKFVEEIKQIINGD